jgi:hypothetical protein
MGTNPPRYFEFYDQITSKPLIHKNKKNRSFLEA